MRFRDRAAGANPRALHALLRRLFAVALAAALAVAGATGIGAVRCTMPDGRLLVEGVASALRCRAEMNQAADATVVPTIGGVCSDELIAVTPGDLAPEREMRRADLAAPNLRQFAPRPPPGGRFTQRSSNPCPGRAAAIRRCIVLQI